MISAMKIPTSGKIDNNGQPKDCWQFTNYLPLRVCGRHALHLHDIQSVVALVPLVIFTSIQPASPQAPGCASDHCAGCRCYEHKNKAYGQNQVSAVHAHGLGAEEPSSTKHWLRLVWLSVKLRRPSR